MEEIHSRGDITNRNTKHDQESSQHDWPDLDLLSFLNRFENAVSGTIGYDGRYTKLSYTLHCREDCDSWRLRIVQEMIQTTTSVTVSSDVLMIDFAMMDRKADKNIQRINVHGVDCDMTSQNIFRSFMAASVIIAQIDARQCPDVLKILRLYGFRQRI